MTIPNYRNQIKIVFFDIDETLIVKNKDYLPESVLPAMRQLKANGIIPAIATGRTPLSFPPKIKALVAEVGIDLFVAMNGQYVSYQGNVLDKHPIPLDKIQRVINFLDRHQIDYAFVSNECVCVSNITPKVRSAMDPLKTDYHIDKDYFKNRDVFQILPFYDASQDALIASSGILDGLKVVRWHENSVDLFDEQGSKARGILSAIRHLDLNIDNVMAFGDGLNDVEMLSTVGVGVAMGNAHEDLKKLAAHVTDHIEQDGIYNFLHKAGLIG
ncbi:MAG TPA: Cof-type HAD-IIB family hydrolase [Pasteurellaceae bacterium]|nr:Cof-type HAD-IIB family hydrolase [Pasteurellaceae bacterium]